MEDAVPRTIGSALGDGEGVSETEKKILFVAIFVMFTSAVFFLLYLYACVYS